MASATDRSFVLGEFATPEDLVEAGRALHADDLGRLDAYSPFPVHGIEQALGIPKSPVPFIALVAGVSGAVGGYLLQWWCNSIDYPINVGGRLIHGWPSQIPITFESGILLCALSLFFGSMALFGLPRPYHPVFEAEDFRSASLDAFWISVESEKLPAELGSVEQRLRDLGARRVQTVRGSLV